MKIIKNVKEDGNHITAMLSYSDLIQLAGYTAVEYCGGPSMISELSPPKLFNTFQNGS